MPAEYVHVACGRDALSSHGAGPAWLDSAAFNLGCQGPDVFSHNRRTKPLALAYARLLHRRSYGAFAADLAEGIAASPSGQVRSWFLGFVTHAAVDRALHPYVISKSCPLGGDLPKDIDRARLHAFFERIMDAEYEMLRSGEEGRVADPSFSVGVPPGLGRLLAPLLADSLRRVYGEKAGDLVESRVENAFADADRVYSLTDPRRLFPLSRKCPEDLAALIGYGPAAVALLRPEGLEGAEDWLNIGRSPWPDPSVGRIRIESAPDLMGVAVKNAALALEAALGALSGGGDAAAVEEAVGNGCLSTCDPEGQPVPVRASAPFDLVTPLLAQTRLRQAWARGEKALG